jgi:(2Fe-2S) ferredoxin
MKDPKGRTSIGFEKHIFICENSRVSGHPRGCCQEKEGNRIKMMFKDEIVKMGLVGKVRANGSACLDFCEQGPTVAVYPEGIWYRIDNPEKDIKDIIKEHIIEDRIVERCVIKL